MEYLLNGIPNFKYGFYINAIGDETVNSDYYISEVIPLDYSSLSSDGFIFYYGTYKSDARLMTINENFEQLLVFGMQENSNSRRIKLSQLDENTKYIKFSFSSDYIDNAKVEDYFTRKTLWETNYTGGYVKKDDIEDTLNSTNVKKVLSANQGRVINEQLSIIPKFFSNTTNNLLKLIKEIYFENVDVSYNYEVYMCRYYNNYCQLIIRAYKQTDKSDIIRAFRTLETTHLDSGITKLSNDNNFTGSVYVFR